MSGTPAVTPLLLHLAGDLRVALAAVANREDNCAVDQARPDVIPEQLNLVVVLSGRTLSRDLLRQQRAQPSGRLPAFRDLADAEGHQADIPMIRIEPHKQIRCIVLSVPV
jgi:hypothetical protein